MSRALNNVRLLAIAVALLCWSPMVGSAWADGGLLGGISQTAQTAVTGVGTTATDATTAVATTAQATRRRLRRRRLRPPS